jgi:ADP-ribosylglycohydrolase
MVAENLEEKVLGALLASALGNAMGSPVENWNYKDIEAKFGRVEGILDPSRLELEDDNRVGLMLCQAYLEKGGPVTPEDLAKVWLREMEPTQFFWCLRNSYELLKAGVSPRVTGTYNIVTGSAIMAIAPAGIFNAGHPDRAFVEALQIGYMYQPRLDTECAAVIAACVAEAMKPGSGYGDVLDVALRFATDEKIVTFDERELSVRGSVALAIEIASEHDDVFEVRSEIYDRLLQWHAIDPVEVLSLTLCMFGVAKGDLVQSILGGVNVGRDSDTIGNLCGALSGAIHGSSAIPQEWISQVKPESVERFRSVASEVTALLVSRARDARDQAVSLLELAGKS